VHYREPPKVNLTGKFLFLDVLRGCYSSKLELLNKNVKIIVTIQLISTATGLIRLYLLCV